MAGQVSHLLGDRLNFKRVRTSSIPSDQHFLVASIEGRINLTFRKPRIVYAGNVVDWVGGNTWCPNCESLLIERIGYAVGQYHLDRDGHCRTCGCAIPGHFEAEPGAWGNRVEPVRMSPTT